LAEIVATKPSDWFKADCAPILEAYCKSIIHYRDLAERLSTPPEELGDYLKLIEATGKQARLMGELASKLRLTRRRVIRRVRRRRQRRKQR